MIAIRDALRELERRHHELLLENKGLSLALPYRQVPRVASIVLREVRALFLQTGLGYHLQVGKCVVEIVPVGQTKGTVVTEFMTEPPFRGRVPALPRDPNGDITLRIQYGSLLLLIGKWPGRHTVVLHRHFDPHGLLAGVFLHHLRGQPTGPAENEDELCEQRRASHVMQQGRKRTVNVDGQRLDELGRRLLQCSHELDTLAGDVVLLRQVEQHIGTRINFCVNAMTQSWQTSLRLN